MVDVIPGQLIVPAAVFGLAVFAVMAVVLAVSAALGVVFWWRDRPHKVGPDALRLLEDLDKHLDHFVATDPEVQAGIARLFEALGTPPATDEARGGEQT